MTSSVEFLCLKAFQALHNLYGQSLWSFDKAPNLYRKFMKELKFTQVSMIQDHFTSVDEITLILFIAVLINCHI